MSLATDLVRTARKPEALKYIKSHTGRPSKCVNEQGEPESAHSIGKRHGCSYGKVLWLFKKYSDYSKVYEVIGIDSRKLTNQSKLN